MEYLQLIPTKLQQQRPIKQENARKRINQETLLDKIKWCTLCKGWTCHYYKYWAYRALKQKRQER